ncbi:MAG: glycoside hydrolase family 3 N-terminal domain-containing protein [Gammaproteobacteria bacterium]
MKKSIVNLLIIFCSSTLFGNQCYQSSVEHAELIERLINKMTLEEKVGQIIQGDLDFVTPSDLKKYKMGSVLNGGNTSPNRNQYANVEEWKAMSKAFYDASPVIDGIKIPFIWGTDAVHGHNNLIGATLFPHNIGLGATRNTLLIEEIGRAVALEVLSTGVIWTFAPALSVPRNDRWGRTYEGFSEDSKLVAQMGSAFVRGLQGSKDEFLDKNHILATSKHFAGDGGTFDGVDQGDVRIPRERFEELHVSPYYSAVDSCTQTVMSSFNSFQGRKLHGYKELLTGLLKEQIGFDGFIVGDWNGHGQVDGCSNAYCPDAFNAGVDIYMAPDSWRDLHRNLIRDVKSNKISLERLNDAVRRILKVKARLGLFDGRKPHEFSNNYLGAKKHKDIARQAVKESLVLLKNNNNLLPLNPNLNIGVIGLAANEIRYQTGGWTLDWQGKNNKNKDFPGVKTIFESISAYVEAENGRVEFSESGNFKFKPDVVISVFGEEPYAEGFGDLRHVGFQETDSQHYQALMEVNALNIPVVSIFISGRPLEVNKFINLSQAFIAAWLPGTEIDGISEVIFATKDNPQSDFKGKLSFSWPINKYQDTLNFGDEGYAPLFPFGYGLDYSSDVFVDQIAISNDKELPQEYEFFRGQALGSNKEFISSNGVVEFIDTSPFILSNGFVEASLFQYLKQDDSKLVIFKKDGLSGFGVTGEALNVKHLENPYIEIVFNYSEQAPVYFNMGCGDNCQATIDLGDVSGDWQIKNIPLSCLDAQGFDRSKISIRGMFLIPNKGELKIHTLKLKSNFNGTSKVETC